MSHSGKRKAEPDELKELKVRGLSNQLFAAKFVSNSLTSEHRKRRNEFQLEF